LDEDDENTWLHIVFMTWRSIIVLMYDVVN
jgi:hypothetical protein